MNSGTLAVAAALPVAGLALVVFLGYLEQKRNPLAIRFRPRRSRFTPVYRRWRR